MSGLLTVCVCFLAAMALAEGAVRRYEWTVKYEFTPPTGYSKQSITINGQTPGPTVSAHQGDILIIEVTNGLIKENLAIQWDGVRQTAEALTGPIPPGKTLAFRFSLDQPGKYPYYAHYKLQRDAGLYGTIRVLPAVVGKKAEPSKQGAEKAGKLPPEVKESGQKIGLSKTP